MSRFAGKVVLVTGSSNGIGRAAARLFAREGAIGVSLTGRDKAALEEARKEVQAESKTVKVLALAGDLVNETFQKELIEKTIKEFGKLDILVNNAGAAGRGADIVMPQGESCFEFPLSHFDYMFTLNTRSVLALVQLAVPHLEKTRGEVVNISSIGGLNFGNPVASYYCAAKAALDHLTRSMALAYIGKGIRVNGINPGTIVTTFFQKLGMSNEEIHKVSKNEGNEKT